MKRFAFVLVVSFLMVGCLHDSGSSDTPVRNDPIQDVVDVDPAPPQEQPDVNEPPVVETDFAELSWVAPLTRQNGDKLLLSEISHYVITHSFNGNEQEVRVDYPQDGYRFDGLSTGTHSFTIVTVDTDGLVSPRSDPVSKTIE